VSTIVALVGDKPYLIPVSNPAYSAAADCSVNITSTPTYLGCGAHARCANGVHESAEYVMPYEGTEPHTPPEYAVPCDVDDSTRIQLLDADGYVVDGAAITGESTDTNYEVVGTFREEGCGIYSPVGVNDMYSGISYHLIAGRRFGAVDV
jgi:hypothetical protein